MMVTRVVQCSARWSRRSLPLMMTWISRLGILGSHRVSSFFQLRRSDDGHTMSSGQSL